MKNLIVLLLAICLISCKKEATYGPLNLKDGQQVELLIDHRLGSDKDILLKLPENEQAGASLAGFEQREPGYTYRIRAVFHYDANPPADGSSYYYEFLNVISKEQYKGTESFDIQLIVSYIPGGPIIRLNKQGTDYYFSDKIQFTLANATVGSQLEEIWKNVQEIRANWQTGQRPKWKAIKATVIHDPQKFGKAYLVQKIEFTP
ncbi:hypothetical protein [Pedobacter paludis]|uniref:DUF4377 domain-containing protein n=1 Tax=Pedobacter paludis TaxID=2203212 RepID=A0A317F6Y0_9SPHI|nr:hypothetical protein [Pedobacter paludis]PWS33278.1 hypothetical protein DF947_01240 [Pedobacter paludis]